MHCETTDISHTFLNKLVAYSHIFCAFLFNQINRQHTGRTEQSFSFFLFLFYCSDTYFAVLFSFFLPLFFTFFFLFLFHLFPFILFIFCVFCFQNTSFLCCLLYFFFVAFLQVLVSFFLSFFFSSSFFSSFLLFFFSYLHFMYQSSNKTFFQITKLKYHHMQTIPFFHCNPINFFMHSKIYIHAYNILHLRPE